LVDGALRVNDLFYLIAPFPMVGEDLTSIGGILELRNGNMKIEPRDATDVMRGPARLVGLGPQPSFTRVGTMDAPTIPQPLSVELSRPADADTPIDLMSSDPTLLQVTTPVVVPAGMQSAPIHVTALMATPSVTITASAGSDTAMATVRVLDGTE